MRATGRASFTAVSQGLKAWSPLSNPKVPGSAARLPSLNPISVSGLSPPELAHDPVLYDCKVALQKWNSQKRLLTLTLKKTKTQPTK